MKLKQASSLLLLFSVALLLTSCSKEDFTSYPPQFGSLGYKKVYAASGTLDDGVIRTGDKVVFTLAQSKKGRLLYKAEYSWTTNMTGGSQKAYPSWVYYDDEPLNPTDTITAGDAGIYSLQFKGKYRISSNQPVSWNATTTLSDGTTVSYVSGGTEYFDVTANKSFTIEAPLK